ncbi:MAG: cobalamin-dependent protein [Magnetococcales bacterium]|nr:cobalamin-dependent protein [Magnetococcales bacterium]
MSESVKKNRHLLVMPRTVQRAGDGYFFPLGILYVSSSLKAAGHEVYTLNLNHRDGRVDEIIADEIQRHQITVVATGGLSFQYNSIRSIVEAAKKVDENIVTILGGGIITSDPHVAMTAIEFGDYGVVGEGELTICELCDCLERGGDVSAVNGVIYKVDQEKYQTTAVREEVKDLNTLPWPDYDGFELEKYLASAPGISGMNRTNTVFMVASRSCPYECTFCFHTTGQKYRQRKMEDFFAELEYMISKYNIDFLCLADELFSTNIRRVRKFCAGISQYNIKWWVQFRVNNVSEELLTLLKSAGCSVLGLGLESADNTILTSMKKRTTIEEIENALKIIYKSGISMEGSFIFGDIAETWETASNTIRWWREHPEYKISLNLISIYPGTYLYEHACKEGIIPDRVAYLKEGCPQVNVSKLNDEEYSELLKVILEAPLTQLKTLVDMQILDINFTTSRIKVSGQCAVCGEAGEWSNLKTFAASFISCEACGQRFNFILPDNLYDNINKQVKSLLEKHRRIAVWGINFQTVNTVKKAPALQDERIDFVDISSTKRKMILHDKTISHPSLIAKENIEAVIIMIPPFFNEISGQIKSNYPGVKEVVDVCSLLSES